MLAVEEPHCLALESPTPKPGFLLTARSKNPLLKEVIRDAMAGVYQVSPSCFHLLKLKRLAVALRVRGSSGSDPSAGTRGAVAVL